MTLRKFEIHRGLMSSSSFCPFSQATGANSQSIRPRFDRERLCQTAKGEQLQMGGASRQQGNLLASFSSQDLSAKVCPPVSPPLASIPYDPAPSIPREQSDYTLSERNYVSTVTLTATHEINETATSAPLIMNTNGTHSQHRHQQPHPQPNSQPPRDKRQNVNESSGSNVQNGPMPSHIQVARPYIFHQAIEACLTDLGVLQAGEDRIRLAGVQWIDNVRKALKLPVRTFDTAVVYYHKFRLSHADNEYSFVDAAAAALFAACKIEDTLKKSRDILCASHNLKLSSRADHLSPDDPSFETHSRAIIGLERLMLEASSFDFRNRHPQPLMVKIEKHYGLEKHSAVTKTAHLISLDLCRTFAPLKQSTATMAFACLELSARLHGQEKEQGTRDICEGREYKRWGIERGTVMETLLDVLELYTLHRPQTIVAPLFNQDIFLDIRIPLNEELGKYRMSRYTEFVDPSQFKKKGDIKSYAAAAATNGVLPTGIPNGPVNGRKKTSPTSPATPGTPGIRQKAGERGKEGTVRFMLNPDRERQEKEVVASYAPLMTAAAARR